MIRRKKPLRRKSTRPSALLWNRADALWKAIGLAQHEICQARAYPGCLGTAILQAHHVVRRRHWGTRWEPTCRLVVCRNCHHWLHFKCLDEPQWYRDHGIDYDFLKSRAESVRRKDIDLALVILDLRREVDGG